jgi:hypothetical protein
MCIFRANNHMRQRVSIQNIALTHSFTKFSSIFYTEFWKTIQNSELCVSKFLNWFRTGLGKEGCYGYSENLLRAVENSSFFHPKIQDTVDLKKSNS